MKTLTQVKGNLLTHPDVQIIGHQTNCQNTYGSGIAKTIKELYPEAYEADCKADQRDENVLGNISYVLRDATLGGPVGIFNLYGQSLTSRTIRTTNYEGIYSALVKMRSKVESLFGDELPTIGFPRLMSSALGGGDWRIVERMIEVVFDSYPNQVYIVDFNT